MKNTDWQVLEWAVVVDYPKYPKKLVMAAFATRKMAEQYMEGFKVADKLKNIDSTCRLVRHKLR